MSGASLLAADCQRKASVHCQAPPQAWHRSCSTAVVASMKVLQATTMAIQRLALQVCAHAGAISGTDTSCTWHASNYPSVDFGIVGTPLSVEACFKTSTQTLNSPDGTFRGMSGAATAEGAAMLGDPEFLNMLATLPLACRFDTGENPYQSGAAHL
jgi:hypothetical protein